MIAADDITEQAYPDGGFDLSVCAMRHLH